MSRYQDDIKRHLAIEQVNQTRKRSEKSILLLAVLSLFFWPGAYWYMWGCGAGLAAFILGGFLLVIFYNSTLFLLAIVALALLALLIGGRQIGKARQEVRCLMEH